MPSRCRSCAWFETKPNIPGGFCHGAAPQPIMVGRATNGHPLVQSYWAPVGEDQFCAAHTPAMDERPAFDLGQYFPVAGEA